MPKYVCHKKVWALKIAEITEPTDATGTSRTIIPRDVPIKPGTSLNSDVSRQTRVYPLSKAPAGENDL